MCVSFVCCNCIGIIEEDEEYPVEAKVPDSVEPEMEEGARAETDSISDTLKKFGRGSIGSVSKAIRSVSDALRRKEYV